MPSNADPFSWLSVATAPHTRWQECRSGSVVIHRHRHRPHFQLAGPQQNGCKEEASLEDIEKHSPYLFIVEFAKRC
ncbi:hypothetical protein EJB05_54558 [Eragrostis curvula]|uniref:Uncharacterized protein n=1 Tax=Eragrostis curvula TaxID=38414 RepID=A0A5J9SM94_9POAL|nr:hypothetical protein EJB05_54558 [Eragrostis curvula]